MKSYNLRADAQYSLRIAQYFQIAWILAAVIVIWLGGSVALSLLLLLLFTAWVPFVVEVVTRTKLPLALHLHYFVFMSAAPVAGSAFGVYGALLDWDTIVHVDSGILLAWLGLFAVVLVEKKAKIRIPRWFALSAALLVPLAFAALWEISEFLSDRIIGTVSQPNLEDTIIDMIAALVGALIGVAMVVIAKWPRSITPSGV